MPFTPRQAANDAITRARALATAAKTAPTNVLRDDLRRLAIVMAVAALDAYLHRRVYQSTGPGKELPSALSKLGVTFVEMADIANASLAARRRNPPVRDRPWVRVRNVLNDRLLRVTFQSPQEVADALAMVGVKQAWRKIADALPLGGISPEVLQSELARVVRRRNQVVHEGDFKQLYRPRTLQRNSVSQSDAENAVDVIQILIFAIDSIP